ncbi:hypothetical protein GCM10027269_31280 [Kribbella endophytica]
MADIAAAVSALTADGYAVWPGLERFLESFGGLEFVVRATDGDLFWVDPVEALRMVYPERVAQYSVEFGTYVAPIGAALADHLVVYLGQDGAFYGSYDKYTCRVGVDVEEALGRLVARELVTITAA